VLPPVRVVEDSVDPVVVDGFDFLIERDQRFVKDFLALTPLVGVSLDAVANVDVDAAAAGGCEAAVVEEGTAGADGVSSLGVSPEASGRLVSWTEIASKRTMSDFG